MIAYSYAISVIFFTILVSMNRFRIGDIVEIAGMDVLDHAYLNDFTIHEIMISSGDGYCITKDMIA